jgi:hypothetical protein
MRGVGTQGAAWQSLSIGPVLKVRYGPRTIVRLYMIIPASIPHGAGSSARSGNRSVGEIEPGVAL